MIPVDLPTTWASTAFGPARWAKAIPVLVDYVRTNYPTVTFLGGLGDQTHVLEGNTSAHNPVTKDPVTGEGIVLAVDLGVSDGNMAPLDDLRARIYAHPNDPRMAGGISPVGSGYLSGPDDKACNWPIGTGWNGGNKDEGHLHVNVAAAYFPFRPGGYLPSMDLTTPWDFMGATITPASGGSDVSYRLIQWQTGIFKYAPGQPMVLLPNLGYVPVCLADPDCTTKKAADIETADQAHWTWYQMLAAPAQVDSDTYTVVSSLPTRIASLQASVAQVLTTQAVPAAGGSVDPGIVAAIVAALPVQSVPPTAAEIATAVAQVLGSKLSV